MKPFPDLFLAALSSLHLRPDQALAFEDSPNGVRAAQAAGLRVVGVPNPITARLGPLPAELTLSSLSDLSLQDVLAHFGDTLLLRPETLYDLPAIRLVEEAAFSRSAEAALVDLVRDRGQVHPFPGRTSGRSLARTCSFHAHFLRPTKPGYSRAWYRSGGCPP